MKDFLIFVGSIIEALGIIILGAFCFVVLFLIALLPWAFAALVIALILRLLGLV